MRRIVIILAVVALMGTAIGAVFASAAAIPTFNGGNVGSGDGDVSGYVVSNVVWTLQTDDPTKIESVTFAITPAAATVFADTNDGGLVACADAGGGLSWDCNLSPNPSTSAVTSLIVSAAS